MTERTDVAPPERVEQLRLAIEAVKARGFSLARIATLTNIPSSQLGRVRVGVRMRTPTVDHFADALAKLPEKPPPREDPRLGSQMLEAKDIRAEVAALKRLRPSFRKGSMAAMARAAGISTSGFAGIMNGRGTTSATLDAIRKFLSKHGAVVDGATKSAPVTVLAKPVEPAHEPAPSTTSIEAVLRMVISTGAPRSIDAVPSDVVALVDQMKADAIAFVLREYARAGGIS